ncbi:hypothetical protein Bind_2104 [Beijerinckia indica subsp. indica ATCC 9039]|uniref:Uncharacterized protein n=1 Tax=Beijerinckia indica subsp. indica (strain ATCC 9039 / DSM 1715 / NCIMB 8712) TaxID=395963 RepID=B2IFY5_BEII9|nr:hypothetical protein Bind_2104 [Beijerinckia indica subsp. indica ATCC 9039]
MNSRPVVENVPGDRKIAVASFAEYAIEGAYGMNSMPAGTPSVQDRLDFATSPNDSINEEDRQDSHGATAYPL